MPYLYFTPEPDFEEERAKLQAEIEKLREEIDSDDGSLAEIVSETRRTKDTEDVQSFHEESEPLRTISGQERRMEMEAPPPQRKHNSGQRRRIQPATQRPERDAGSQKRRAGCLGTHSEVGRKSTRESRPLEPADEDQGVPRFEINEDSSGKHRWRLMTSEGETVAESSRGYRTEREAEKAVEKFQRYVPPGDYLHPDPTAAVEIHRGPDDKFGWRLVHRNGELLAEGTRSYSNRTSVKRVVERMRNRIEEMRVEVFEKQDGYGWRLLNKRNQKIAENIEVYSSRTEAEKATDQIQRYIPESDTLDVGQAAFEIYGSEEGGYSWLLRHRNGKILAETDELYTDKPQVWKAIETVKRNTTALVNRHT